MVSVEDEHEEPGLFPRLQKRTQHSITVHWTYIRDDSEYSRINITLL
jgi:hypothetical protein